MTKIYDLYLDTIKEIKALNNAATRNLTKFAVTGVEKDDPNLVAAIRTNQAIIRDVKETYGTMLEGDIVLIENSMESIHFGTVLHWSDKYVVVGLGENELLFRWNGTELIDGAGTVYSYYNKELREKHLRFTQAWISIRLQGMIEKHMDMTRVSPDKLIKIMDILELNPREVLE